MHSTKSKPSLEDKVRARAHEIWLQEGQPEGRELAHWQQAEAEIAGAPTPRKPARAPRASDAAARPSAAASGSKRRKEAAE